MALCFVLVFPTRLADRWPLPLSAVLPALSSWDLTQLAPMRVIEPSSPDDLLSLLLLLRVFASSQRLFAPPI